MRIVLHVGVHKTASTLIQTNLAANGAALRAVGVFCINTEMPEAIRRQREFLRRLQNPGRTTPAPDALGRLNRKILRTARGTGATCILLSEENTIGTTFARQLQWGLEPAGFYPMATECLGAVTVGWHPSNITLLLYSRQQDALLRSNYSEGLRNLQIADDLAGFAARIELNGLRFDALADRLTAACPGAALQMRPFETIRDGPRTFLERFLSRVGIPTGGFEFQTEAVRPSLDADQAEELRALAHRRLKGEAVAPLRREAAKVQARPPNPDRPMVVPSDLGVRLRRLADTDCFTLNR